MSVIFVLLPLALLFAGICLAWFVWAVRSGQYDDLETPAVRVLFDDGADPRQADAPRSAPEPSPWSPSRSQRSAPRPIGKAKLP